MLTADNIEGPYRYQAPVVISGFKKGTEYKNTDLELLIGTQSTLPNRYAEPWASTGKASMPNNIDPCVFYDEEGHLWMSYGSWSGGIFMLELDETTGLRDYDVTYPLSTNSDPYFGKRIAGGYYVSGEASYIEYIGGYYYLFVSYGGLAAGGNPDDYNNGGYQMRVFRSDKPDGPYKDAKGNNAVYSSFTVNFGTSDTSNRGVNIFGAYGEWGNQANGNYGERSQGHNSIIAAEDGRTYLVYHTRFQNAGESHQVRVHQVFQNAKGWLVVAPFEYTGETVTSADVANSQQVSTNRVAGTYQLLVHRYKLDHTKKEQATPVEIQLNVDGTISGALSGNWTIHEGTSYIDIKLGSVTYQGVMVEQTLEPTTTTTIAFTAVSTSGVSGWGYQTAKASAIHKMNADALNIETPVYDLSGRYVSSINRRGIYIQKGRKLLTR
jgi:arabinan endo-1,5-alpha-L-arabinosidase